ncbi:MAG: hypothetical protein K2X38_11960, partial [Gemmataceae bacterium]|nr:hypothetical protein [Gemmataceae bacterium]
VGSRWSPTLGSAGERFQRSRSRPPARKICRTQQNLSNVCGKFSGSHTAEQSTNSWNSLEWVARSCLGIADILAAAALRLPEKLAAHI